MGRHRQTWSVGHRIHVCLNLVILVTTIFCQLVNVTTTSLRYGKEMERDRGFCDIWVNLFRAAFANVELGWVDFFKSHQNVWYRQPKIHLSGKGLEAAEKLDLAIHLVKGYFKTTIIEKRRKNLIGPGQNKYWNHTCPFCAPCFDGNNQGPAGTVQKWEEIQWTHRNPREYQNKNGILQKKALLSRILLDFTKTEYLLWLLSNWASYTSVFF